MTREEAVHKFELFGWNESYKGRFIDALEALGLLKLEQPRSTKDKFIEALEAWTTADARKIWEELLNAGLEIVERKK